MFIPDSLQCFATDIGEKTDLSIILTHLISHELLTTEQREYLTHIVYTSTEKKRILINILLSLDENGIKKFLQCLSETSYHEPHKNLLEKIKGKHMHLLTCHVN